MFAPNTEFVPGIHNHSQGQLVETQDEIEMLLKWTDPKKFHWCPDTVHLYMANCDIIGLFTRIRPPPDFLRSGRCQIRVPEGGNAAAERQSGEAGFSERNFHAGNRDYGDGEVDLQGIMRILKEHKYKGWINIDHHYSRVSPRNSLERCMKYIQEKMDPIYS